MLKEKREGGEKKSWHQVFLADALYAVSDRNPASKSRDIRWLT